jgi:hypothetical protein
MIFACGMMIFMACAFAIPMSDGDANQTPDPVLSIIKETSGVTSGAQAFAELSTSESEFDKHDMNSFTHSLSAGCNEGELTGNRNGAARQISCPAGKFINVIQWREQGGYGLVNVRIRCDDNTDLTAHGNMNGGWNTEMRCTNGFSELEANEQGGYGIVNVRAKCVGSQSWITSNGNHNGAWRSDVRANGASKLVSIDSHEQGGYGIVNAKARMCTVARDCGHPRNVRGTWKVAGYSNGQREFGYTTGTTTTDGEERTSEWEAEVGVTVSAGFSFFGAESSVEVSSSYSQGGAETITRSIERSTERSLTTTFPHEVYPHGGVVWQFDYLAQDTCGSSTIKTEDLVITGNRAQGPCCLPGFAKNPGQQHGPCAGNSPCSCAQSVCGR